MISFHLLLHAFPADWQAASADELHVLAVNFLPLVGLARSEPDAVNHGYGAHCHDSYVQNGFAEP